MPRLSYHGGKNPFVDIHAFTAHAKATYPGITQDGINHLVKLSLDNLRERQRNRVYTLFGADIMCEHPEDLAIWPHLPRSHKERVLAHPLVGGTRVEEYEDHRVAQMELALRLDRRAVNRSVLISPRGLEYTYVWRQSLSWEQEVSQKDYDLLMSVAPVRRLLKDPEIVGPYQPVRSYEAPVIERHVARDGGDVQALQRQYRRVPTFTGADLKKG